MSKQLTLFPSRKRRRDEPRAVSITPAELSAYVLRTRGKPVEQLPFGEVVAAAEELRGGTVAHLEITPADGRRKQETACPPRKKQ